MKTYDVVTIGVISKDVNIVMGKEELMYSGGSYCAAYAAVNSGFKVAMVTKLADEDRQSLRPLQAAGTEMGAKEIVLTNNAEVMAYAGGHIYRAPFKARNLSGCFCQASVITEVY